MRDSGDWDRRYRDTDHPWDLGRPAPALSEVFSWFAGSPRRVLVPGSGLGNDALAWARHGHDVVAVDFSEVAVERLQSRARAASVDLEVLRADVTEPLAELTPFDVIWDHTCLCALERDLAPRYVAAAAAALLDGGQWIGVGWNNGRAHELGPPYDISKALMRELLGTEFIGIDCEIEASFARDGEYLVRATRSIG